MLPPIKTGGCHAAEVHRRFSLIPGRPSRGDGLRVLTVALATLSISDRLG